MATKFVLIGISMLDGVPIGIYVDPMTSPTGQHGRDADDLPQFLRRMRLS